MCAGLRPFSHACVCVCLCILGFVCEYEGLVGVHIVLQRNPVVSEWIRKKCGHPCFLQQLDSLLHESICLSERKVLVRQIFM